MINIAQILEKSCQDHTEVSKCYGYILTNNLDIYTMETITLIRSAKSFHHITFSKLKKIRDHETFLFFIKLGIFFACFDFILFPI